MKKMSQEQYVKTEGSRCPFCESINIVADGNVEVDSGGGSQRVSCDDCDKVWYDCYTLTGYIEQGA